MPHPREVIRADRVRAVPESFSWIDRQLLHGGYLEKLTTEEIALYFFLVLVSGPGGTSYWGYPSIARLLKLSVDDLVHATAGLVKKGLIAFRYPTFQVLSLPPTEGKRSGQA